MISVSCINKRKYEKEKIVWKNSDISSFSPKNLVLLFLSY